MSSHRILLIPKSVDYSDIMENMKEATSTDPIMHGWSLIMWSRCHGYVFGKCLERTIKGTYGSYGDIRPEHNDIIKVDRGYYSTCDDMMVVVSTFGNETKDCHFKVWAKNIVSGNKLDMLEAYFTVRHGSSLYSEGIVLKQSHRSDILGRDYRDGEYINAGITDARSAEQVIRRRYGNERDPVSYYVSSMNVPVAPWLDIAKCAMSGVMHVGGRVRDIYRYDKDTGYTKDQIRLATIDMSIWHESNKEYKCNSCGKNFIDEDAVCVVNYERCHCGECLWRNHYASSLCITDDEDDARYIGSNTIERNIMPMFPHIKTVKYRADVKDGALLSQGAIVYSDTHEEVCHSMRKYDIVVPIMSDRAKAFIGKGYDSVISFVIQVGDTEGHITICCSHAISKVLLHVKDGNMYRYYGSIHKHRLIDLVIDQDTEGVDTISFPIVFSYGIYSNQAAREDSVIKICTAINRGSIKRLKRHYAKTLLMGGWKK